MDKINKLILPITILIASIILGGFFYASQINKQKSIERQQILKQIEDRRIEDEKLAQEKKEYVVKRKKDCYDIETSERKKFNNIDESFYDELNDICKVIYINKDYKEGAPNSCEAGYQSIFSNPDDKEGCIKKYFTKDF